MPIEQIMERANMKKKSTSLYMCVLYLMEYVGTVYTHLITTWVVWHSLIPHHRVFHPKNGTCTVSQGAVEQMWRSGRSVCWKDGMGPRDIQLGSASISLKQLCVELVGARKAGFVHSSGLWGCIGYTGYTQFVALFTGKDIQKMTRKWRDMSGKVLWAPIKDHTLRCWL